MARFPGCPGWDSEGYWMGVATTLAFMQADLDSERSFYAGNRENLLSVRLPYLEKPEPQDLDRFGRAVSELNEEAAVLFWHLVETDSWGEHHIVLTSTEGYIGWSPSFAQQYAREGWRS